MQRIHFLLVPDSSAARRVRRTIAETGARKGVVIGTWLELIEHAGRAYLIPQPGGGWSEQLHAALSQVKEAFWSGSFLVAPQETSTAIESALIQIISATDPFATFNIADFGELPERPRRHLEDLIRLSEVLQGKLPPSLSIVQLLLKADAAEATQHICVYDVEKIPVLSRWQLSLVEKLNNDAKITLETDLNSILSRVLSGTEESKVANSLTTLKDQLYSPNSSPVTLDHSIQWVGVRDFLEEAEVAAGMAQIMLKEQDDLRPCDIGLLLPESFEYSVAVEDAFTLAGLALSGLPAERWRRDLGREALFHFLYCRQKPAPAMALAVCLSSPLMPWSREDGAVLAQRIMDGNYSLKPLASLTKDACAMLDLLREGDEAPSTLKQAVQAFLSLLNPAEVFAVHAHQARLAADSLYAELEQATDLDWLNLRRSVNPRYITTGESPNYNLEGVTVWRESHEPWRPVRHLIVLGFAEGNYPVVPGTSPVFVADELRKIRDCLNLPVEIPEYELMSRRARFKRQLGSVQDFISFLVPHRNPDGMAQAPSESIVFMQQIFDITGEIILELDATADRAQVRYLSHADPVEPQQPRDFTANDIHFEQNLLALRLDDKGQLKPESPSSLETLMVSRLAWLLRQLNAEPLVWMPEGPNVMLLGTLSHQVFEELFQKDLPIPGRDEIPAQVESLLDNAIAQHGPFLRASQWQVERKHLTAGIVEAAIAWAEVLNVLGAEVLGSEEWLEGNLNGIRIHGQADVILGLANNRLLVVDYKRSSSSSRRPRMQQSYDCQASLYRTMLQTGGPKDTENAELISRIKAASQTGIVYYMLNDKIALSDTILLESGGIPHWEAIEGDIASQAIALIERRLSEVSEGVLNLNRESDALFFEKQAGIKPYAMDMSPLISLFTIPGEAE